MTIDEFEAYLQGLGRDVSTLTGGDLLTYTVVHAVRVPAGALMGRVCDVAIQRNGSVPFIPPAAIHVRPALVPMGTLATQASALGPEWQYWSRRFDRPPTPRALWAHVLTVLSEVP